MDRRRNEWTNELMSEQTDSSLLSNYVFLCNVPSAKSICPHLQLN